MAAPITDDLVAAAAAEEAAVASPVDLLPTPEEIAKAASGAPAHSTVSMQSTPGSRGLGKGLGGTGLAPKRKGKGSGASTISAASAPPAVALPTGSGSGKAKGTSGLGAASCDGNGTISNRSSGTGKQAVTGNRNKQAKGSTAAGSSKQSVDSFATEITEASSGREMAGSTHRDGALLADDLVKMTTPEEGTATGNKRNVADTGVKVQQRAELEMGDAGGWQAAVLEAFDAPTMVFCGTVLGLCVGCLLLFGSKAYFTSK
eukprot:gene11719-11863_t